MKYLRFTVYGFYAAYTLLKYNDPLYDSCDFIIHYMSYGHFLAVAN